MEFAARLWRLCLSVLALTVSLQDATPANRNTIISYQLPDKRPIKKALGFIEDTYLNFTELADKYNYPYEAHSVVTEDGYILTVFRILPKCDSENKYPILLLHGINDSADGWILSGPETGFGYILSRNCYDVWLGNHRGNFYSRKHVKYDPNKDIEYWNYSFDEHGYYDIPAMVDYILKTTGKPKVSYVGHSQGTTSYFVTNSLRPEYNEKFFISFHLAPVAFLGHVKSPFLVFAARQGKQVKNLLDTAGIHEILGKHHISHELSEFLCQIAAELFCGTALALSTGYQPGSIAPKTLAVAFGHLLTGISSKNLAHFGQLVTTGKFQRYDEGRKGNLKRYNSVRPPQYNISMITSPVVLICGQSDWLAPLMDVDKLSDKLPNVVEKYIVPESGFSHNTHLWGVDAPKYVFSKVLEVLKDFK